METDARTLIAQHAKTAQLMGVDFLPLGSAASVQVSDDQPRSTPPPADAPAFKSPTQPEFKQPTTDAKPIDPASIRSAYDQVNGQQSKLDAICAKYELDAPHQHFNSSFTNIVFGEGDPNADLMFIGEAPGEQEDQTGRPFVGRAGQLLENMIKAMGLSRESVYITNVLKVRPPNNATPTSNETMLSSPYLFEQIRVIEPRVIVTLGLPATQLLLSSNATMRSMRGRWHSLNEDQLAQGIPSVEIMPTYHPAYLLRAYTDENRRKVWSDLTMVMKKLGL